MNKKTRAFSRYAIWLAIFVIAVIACSKKLENNILADVGGESITKDEFVYYINKYGKTSEEFKGEAGKRKVLEKLIEFKLVLAVAKKYGEDKDKNFLVNYQDYLRYKHADYFKRNLIKHVSVTDDEVEVEFIDRNKNSGKKKSKEEIASEKEKIKEYLYAKKYQELLEKELEKLKKENNIKRQESVLDELEAGKEVSEDVIIFEVNDEKFDYFRVKSLIPPDVRHSSDEKLRKKKFLSVLIDEEIKTTLLANEAKRMQLYKFTPVFDMENKEYYERVSVNRLDSNKNFSNELYGEVKVSDEEVVRYYNGNKEKFKKVTPELKIYRFVFANEKDAKSIYDDFKKGTEWEKISKKYLKKLKDSTWDVGYVSEATAIEKFGEAFKNAVFALKANEASNILQVDGGYVVAFVVDEKKEESVSTIPEVSAKIKETIKMQKCEEVLKNYIKNLRDESNVRINEELLKSISAI